MVLVLYLVVGLDEFKRGGLLVFSKKFFIGNVWKRNIKRKELIKFIFIDIGF